MARKILAISSLTAIIYTVAAQYQYSGPGQSGQQYYGPQQQQLGSRYGYVGTDTDSSSEVKQQQYEQPQQNSQQQLGSRYNYGGLDTDGSSEQQQQQYVTDPGQASAEKGVSQQPYNTQPRTSYSPYESNVGGGNSGTPYSQPYSQQQQPQYYGSDQRQRRNVIVQTIPNDVEPYPTSVQFYPDILETAVVSDVVGSSQNVRKPRVAEFNTTESSAPTNVLLPTTTETDGLLTSTTLAAKPILRKEGRALPLWALSEGFSNALQPLQRTLASVQSAAQPFYVYGSNNGINSSKTVSGDYKPLYGIDNLPFQQPSRFVQAPPNALQQRVTYGQLPEPQQTYVILSDYEQPPYGVNNSNQPPPPQYNYPLYQPEKVKSTNKAETIFLEEYQPSPPPQPPTPQQQQQLQQNQLKTFLEQQVTVPVSGQSPVQPQTTFYGDEIRAPSAIEAVQQQPARLVPQLQQQLPPPTPDFVNRHPPKLQQQPNEQAPKEIPTPSPSTRPQQDSLGQQIIVQLPEQQRESQNLPYYSPFQVQQTIPGNTIPTQRPQPNLQQSYYSTDVRLMPEFNSNNRELNGQYNQKLDLTLQQQPGQQQYMVQQNRDVETIPQVPSFDEQDTGLIPIPTAVLPPPPYTYNQRPFYQVIPQSVLRQRPQPLMDLVPVQSEPLPPIEAEVLPPLPHRQRQPRPNPQPVLNPRVWFAPQQQLSDFVPPPAYGPPVIGLTTVVVDETEACRTFLDAHPLRVNSSIAVLSVQQTLLDNPLVNDVPTAQVMICCVHKFTRFGRDKMTLDNNGNLLPCNYVLNAFVEQVRLQKLSQLQQQQNNEPYMYPSPSSGYNQTYKQNQVKDISRRLISYARETTTTTPQPTTTPSATTTASAKPNHPVVAVNPRTTDGLTQVPVLPVVITDQTTQRSLPLTSSPLPPPPSTPIPSSISPTTT